MKNEYCYHRKLTNLSSLCEFVQHNHTTGAVVVFTNGCFDILHNGHIRYLRESRMLGDYLIVGVNSDQSVKRLKGEKRPLNLESARVEVLEALDFVSKIIIFNEDTPYNIICQVKPDIYTKGGDYDMSNVIGPGLGTDIVENYGGKVVLIPSVENISTTNLIGKMQCK